MQLGQVVQKLVNSNPGLTVSQIINFSCMKVFLCCVMSKIIEIKTKAQKKQTEKNTRKNIKILANPGLT